MKADYDEVKRLKQWEVNLISSGKSTNRDIGFGESDRSALVFGRHYSRSRKPGANYSSIYSEQALKKKKNKN